MRYALIILLLAGCQQEPYSNTSGLLTEAEWQEYKVRYDCTQNIWSKHFWTCHTPFPQLFSDADVNE